MDSGNDDVVIRYLLGLDGREAVERGGKDLLLLVEDELCML